MFGGFQGNQATATIVIISDFVAFTDWRYGFNTANDDMFVVVAMEALT